MKDNNKLLSLYVDTAQWDPAINVDDFIITIGKKKSNSVYHIAEVREKNYPEKRITRYYVKCYRSDLITALKGDDTQKIIPITWYNRNKKK